ncbi:MAG: hypothetical protein PEGG_00526 [Paraeggerthella hongkongensis]|uniref:Dinitrogenase iron-molybdenum cofactor biosynthesis protein n=1 Tax=Paraeggerthella hongkongensis TaxID=230658 RepID=A0A369LCD5_9ACTN|nr:MULTISPECIES: NifB/NifX family molybdenum-iron cluster-binding protein [Paraeggerthella]MBU5406459.1 dinitrogenase iron-molybdenum cofactor biosynthesis protein [Paraeggerthella hongkongensis]MCD2434180.1 dinitrogenase iron-molybdenum cofactor biosynthesis protein [Paraeggerthella hominis]RDB56327.1 dinitrogenase iron-molybdenum cofactor biosynthesis protein [Paraeggerthella hongkongensis]RNL42605.1 dinitrogenase iron-molybdenum cofactor biosynthesis protein [Paraeggerthella hongkongensis]
MRIAVASEGLKVSPVFGKCASFTCYRIERGVIVECQNMPNPLFPPNRLASLLHELDVRVLITGTIEREAAEALRAVDIEVVPNRGGTARHAAEVYLARTLIGSDESDEEELDVVEA